MFERPASLDSFGKGQWSVPIVSTISLPSITRISFLVSGDRIAGVNLTYGPRFSRSV